MITRSPLSGCQPVAAATAIVGCLLSCTSAFAQSHDVLDEPQGLGVQTVSIGSRLAQFEFQPSVRPMKRPFYLELYGADIERPKRRLPTVADVKGALTGAMTIMRRPIALPTGEIVLPREAGRPHAEGLPIANLTSRQFMDLVAFDFGPVSESDSSTSTPKMAGHDPQLEASELLDPFRVSRFKMAEPQIPGGRPKRRTGNVEELACLTEVMYFEARGESLAGKHAVAMTVLNRVRSKRFPNTVCAVVKQGKGELHKCQFSYYCDGHPERIHEERAYLEIKELARSILESGAADRTDGATYFHTVSVSPSWAEQMQMTARIGHHVFYREPN